MPPNTNRVLRAGAGFFLGFGMVAGLLELQNLLGGGISFFPPLGVMLIGTLSIAVVAHFRQDRIERPTSRLHRKACVVLIIGLALVFILPGFVDVILRPLFPWDAWYTYALQAKTYSHFHKIVEFVGQRQWRTQSGDLVFSTYTGQGILVPLVQAWLALGLGRWSETLVNIPWPLAWLSLALIISGSALEVGYEHCAAALVGLGLVTVPMVGVHAVLAGYLDLWLAGFSVLVAVSLSFILRGEAKLRWLVVAVASAAAACSTKKYGGVFVVLLSGAALAAFPTARTQRYLLPSVCLLGLAAIGYLAAGAPFDLSIHLGKFGELGISGGAMRVPGIRPLTLSSGAPGAESLLGDIFASRSFGMWGWLCAGLIGLNAANFFLDPQGRFVIYWSVAIVFSSWAVFSFTQASHYIEIGTVTQRFLLVVLSVTYSMCISPLAGIRPQRRSISPHAGHVSKTATLSPDSDSAASPSSF